MEVLLVSFISSPPGIKGEPKEQLQQIGQMRPKNYVSRRYVVDSFPATCVCVGGGGGVHLKCGMCFSNLRKHSSLQWWLQHREGERNRNLFRQVRLVSYDVHIMKYT